MQFIAGLIAFPLAMGAYLLYDSLLPERACTDTFLGCMVEMILVLALAGLVVGVAARLTSRGWGGLLALLGGLVAAIVGPALIASGGVFDEYILEGCVFGLAWMGIPALAGFLATGATVRVVRAMGGEGPRRDRAWPGAGRFWDGSRWLEVEPGRP